MPTACARFLLIHLASPTPSPHAGHTRAVTHAVQPGGGTPESIIVATLITAIATGILAIFAVITAWYARKAFREQKDLSAKQTPVLELQARELEASREQRRLEDWERRIAQVSSIFTWEERSTDHALGLEPAHIVTAHVKNASHQPVYDMFFSWPKQDRQDRTIRAKPLMSGDQDADWRPIPSGTDDPSRFRAAVIFRDQGDRWWRIWPNGKFDDLGRHEQPLDYW